MEDDDAISSSTRYRYSKTENQTLLPSFLIFKHKYQNIFSHQRIRQIKKVYQHGICGRNEHKHLVVVDRIGSIKLQELNKVLFQDELISYLNQRMLELSENQLEEGDQIIWIVDLKGKIMQLASKKVIDIVTRIAVNVQKFFPEILYRLVFVNTPMLFDTVWNKITPTISQSTQEKIVFIGDQLQNISQFADPSILPQFLGGEISEEQFISGQFTSKLEHKQEDEEQEEEFDFSQLKQALGGMKFGGKSLQSVSQTPLNTETDK